jgi:hypothetical protein
MHENSKLCMNGSPFSSGFLFEWTCMYTHTGITQHEDADVDDDDVDDDVM